MSSLLRFERVACERGGRMLFERLDLHLGAGEALWVRGPNGAGKSSLLRLAAGLLRPAAGEVEAAPAALADDALALDREQPLASALGWWAALDGGSVSDAQEAYDLSHLAEVPVRMLSTGQARRARLARVLASGAPLWLLDEPVNGLDHDSVARLGRVLQTHRAAGGAIVAASHVSLPGGDWRTLELGV
ncbi:MAG TPA: heme ABC exporter ATP-binding protein CcmA [Sphingomicrobium sp.]|nr:heme ABC exporter ATP-binding protein CcmA [Sphingomicrobium sp.]